MNRFVCAALAASVFCAFGCEQKPSASVTTDTGATSPPVVVLTALNTTCPYSGKPIDPAMTVATQDSVNIGFCCKGCKAKFEMLDRAGQDAVVAKINTSLAQPSPIAPEGEAPIIATPEVTGG